MPVTPVLLFGPRPVGLDRDERDAHGLEQRQHGLALRRLAVDCQHGEPAALELLEHLLQVRKLLTAARSTREPERQQDHAPAVVGEFHERAVAR